eukprot:jgi/Psemu1/53673/gm1.53673_g
MATAVVGGRKRPRSIAGSTYYNSAGTPPRERITVEVPVHVEKSTSFTTLSNSGSIASKFCYLVMDLG